MPWPMKVEIVGFGLVFATVITSLLVGMVSGGFKLGRLARQVDIVLPTANVPGFLERFHGRVAELGFQPDAAGGPGQFVQGGKHKQPGLFTHAKTLKQLQLNQTDAANAQVKISLHLCYLDPILADTGESAYRDAVLDYLSGKTDAMRVVPNLSFAALNSFVGGIYSWLALPALALHHFKPICPPIFMLTGAGLGIGIVAVLAIRQKPEEVTGRVLALAGIAANTAAALLAAVLALLKIV